MDQYRQMGILGETIVALILQAIVTRTLEGMVHGVFCLHRAWFRVLINSASVITWRSTPARFLPCHRLQYTYHSETMRLLALPGRFRRNVLCRYRYAFLLSCQRSGHRELPRQRSGYQVTMPQPELHCYEHHMHCYEHHTPQCSGDMTRRLALVVDYCPQRELQAKPLLYLLYHQ